MTLVLMAAGIVLVVAQLPVRAQECVPAGTAVEVHANVAGAAKLTVSYTVVNNTGTKLSWMSIGTGGPERTYVVPQQTPVVQSAPSGWRGQVVYPEETSHMHLWWEAKDAGAALLPGATAHGFVAEVAGPTVVQQGLRAIDGSSVRPIDFGNLPFAVGGTGAQCWWGRVSSMAGSRGRGDRPNIGIQLTALRAADDAGRSAARGNTKAR